jgi:hypothetical protein
LLKSRFAAAKRDTTPVAAMTPSQSILNGMRKSARVCVSDSGTAIRGATNCFDSCLIERSAEQGLVLGTTGFMVTAKPMVRLAFDDQTVPDTQRIMREARPRIIVRCRNHSGSHRIELDIAAACEQVPVRIDNHRLESTLPQRPAPSVSLVDPTHITSTESLHHAARPVDIARRDEKVHVIGHEYVGMDVAPASAAGRVQRVPVFHVVFRREEDGLPIVSSLDDMQRYTG